MGCGRDLSNNNITWIGASVFSGLVNLSKL